MAKPGRKPGVAKFGGRKKGSRNRANVRREKEIAKTGETPLAYLLRVMRNPNKPAEERLNAAKYAAPFVHPKLTSVEHKGEGGGPIQMEYSMSPLEAARRLAFILELGARAKA